MHPVVRSCYGLLTIGEHETRRLVGAEGGHKGNVFVEDGPVVVDADVVAHEELLLEDELRLHAQFHAGAQLVRDAEGLKVIVANWLAVTVYCRAQRGGSDELRDVCDELQGGGTEVHWRMFVSV